MRYPRVMLSTATAVIVVVVMFIPRPVWGLDFYDYLRLGVTPIPCSGNDTETCPLIYPRDTEPNYSFQQFYESGIPPSTTSYNAYKQNLLTYSDPEQCATRYAPLPTPTSDPSNARPFTTDPRSLHFWAEDQDITALGKAVDRSRQFIFWTLMRPSVDQAIPLKQIWAMNRNIALGLMILVTATLGLAISLSLRLRSGYKFSVQSALSKILLSLIYIALSAAIVYALIALTDVLMRFFIESLGGDKVFNTYFGQTSSEANYVGFVGCRDLNIRVQEGAQAEIFLLKVTIITNYMMGIMFILRKVILWFLLLVAPFLPILLSFPLIRNTGRIWIGVFFQWLFYGPLFALFFGATAKLFTDGIPYVFDFSRIEQVIGYVFPTAIRITYGGPAQTLSGLNNGNYIDTFAEYVISLVLWWAATWFPWWLLRIFRDDCCDGIYAIKNALYGYFDKSSKPTPTPPPPHGPSFERPPSQPLQTVPEKTRATDTRDRRVVVRLDDVNMVRQAKTRDIVSTLNLHTSTLRDVARLETNHTLVQTAKQNLAHLANPLTAQTSSERQKFLNLRTELFTRASTRNDTFAQYILSTTSRTSQTYITRRNEMAKSIQNIANTVHNQKDINLAQSVVRSVYAPVSTVYQSTSSEVNSLVSNASNIQSISQHTKAPPQTVTTVLQAYAQSAQKSFEATVDEVAVKTQQTKDRVRDIIREAFNIINTNKVVQTTTQVVNNIVSNTTALQSIAATAGATAESTKQVLVSYLQHLGASFGEVVERIAQSTGLPLDQIRAVLHETYQMVMRARNVQRATHVVSADREHLGKMLTQINTYVTQSSTQSKEMAPSERISPLKTLFADATVSRYTRELLQRSSGDGQLITLLQTSTGLSKKQVDQTLRDLSNAPSIVDDGVIDHLRRDTGVSSEKVLQVVLEALRHTQIAQTVVAPRGSGEPEPAEMIANQIETALDPASQVDQLIPLPEQAESLEEYEEIKQLWVEQYRTGEVPVSDQVHTRWEWVSGDVMVITEVLSKLLSTDETVRQQALDEVGFILPVFLMNNLTGLQLITYLKAKVSAAKQVSSELSHSEDPSDDDLQEVRRSTSPADENTKHLEVDESGEARTAEEHL